MTGVDQGSADHQQAERDLVPHAEVRGDRLVGRVDQEDLHASLRIPRREWPMAPHERRGATRVAPRSSGQAVLPGPQPHAKAGLNRGIRKSAVLKWRDGTRSRTDGTSTGNGRIHDFDRVLGVVAFDREARSSRSLSRSIGGVLVADLLPEPGRVLGLRHAGLPERQLDLLLLGGQDQPLGLQRGHAVDERATSLSDACKCLAMPSDERPPGLIATLPTSPSCSSANAALAGTCPPAAEARLAATWA